MHVTKHRWSWQIARVAGIRIRIHISFLLLFLLLLPGVVTTPMGAAAELAWIGLVFACVLLHELAHSVTATHLGIRVKDIVLLPIGGASEMERLPDDPRTELAIAGAGPAASLAIAAVALGTSAALGQHWWPPGLLAGSVLARLGWLNVVLGGFNLLPILPMDGGRLLRAALEPRLGRTRSVMAAARVGRVGGALMIALGLFYNLWLVFIGVFILLGASVEGADAEAHERLSVVRVENAMMTWPWTAEAHLHIGPAALDQTIARQGVLPVTVDGRYVGVIGPDQRDRLVAGASAGEAADHDAAVVRPDEPLDHALDVLQRGGQPAVVVVAADGTVRGIVTAGNLRWVIDSSTGARR